MAKPIKMLELHYPMIQFLIMNVTLSSQYSIMLRIIEEPWNIVLTKMILLLIILLPLYILCNLSPG